MTDYCKRRKLLTWPKWRKNVRKTNCGNNELVCRARAVKEGRRSGIRRLQMWLGVDNRRRVWKLGCFYYRLSYHQRNITCSPRSARSCLRFLKDSFILPFSLKNTTRSTPPNCLLSNPLHSSSNMEDRLQKWFMHLSQYYFSTFEARGTQIWQILSIFLQFYSKRSKQALCAWQK